MHPLSQRIKDWGKNRSANVATQPSEQAEVSTGHNSNVSDAESQSLQLTDPNNSFDMTALRNAVNELVMFADTSSAIPQDDCSKASDGQTSDTTKFSTPDLVSENDLAPLKADHEPSDTAKKISTLSSQIADTSPLNTLPQQADGTSSLVTRDKSVSSVNEAIKLWLQRKNPVGQPLATEEPESEQPPASCEPPKPIHKQVSVETPERTMTESESSLPVPFSLPVTYQPSSTDGKSNEGMHQGQGQNEIAKPIKTRQKLRFGVPDLKAKTPIVPIFMIPDSIKAYSKSRKTTPQAGAPIQGRHPVPDTKDEGVSEIQTQAQQSAAFEEHTSADETKLLARKIVEARTPFAKEDTDDQAIFTTPKTVVKPHLANAISAWSSARSATSNTNYQHAHDNNKTSATNLTPIDPPEVHWDQRTERRLRHLSLEPQNQGAQVSNGLADDAINQLQPESVRLDAHRSGAPPSSEPEPTTPKSMQDHEPERFQVNAPGNLHDVAAHSHSISNTVSKPKSRVFALLAERISNWSTKTYSSRSSHPQLEIANEPNPLDPGDGTLVPISLSTESPADSLIQSGSNGTENISCAATTSGPTAKPKTDFCTTEQPESDVMETDVMEARAKLEEPTTDDDAVEHHCGDQDLDKSPQADAHSLSLSNKPDQAERSEYSHEPCENDKIIASKTLMSGTDPTKQQDTKDDFINDPTTNFNRSLRADAAPFTPSRAISLASTETEHQQTMFGATSLRSASETTERHEIQQLHRPNSCSTGSFKKLASASSRSLSEETQSFGEHLSELSNDYGTDEDHLQTRVETLVRLETSKAFSQTLSIQSRLESILQAKIETAVQKEASKVFSQVTDRLELWLKSEMLKSKEQVNSIQTEVESALEAKMFKTIMDQATLQEDMVKSMVKTEISNIPVPPPPFPQNLVEGLVQTEVSRALASPLMLQAIQKHLDTLPTPIAQAVPAALPTSQTSGEASPAFTTGVKCWECGDAFYWPHSMIHHMNSFHAKGMLDDLAYKCKGPWCNRGAQRVDFPLACPGCDRIYATVAALFQHLECPDKICTESFHSGKGTIWTFMGQLRSRLRMPEAYMYGRRI